MVQIVILTANGESRTMRTTAIVAGAEPTGVTVGKALRKTKPAEKIGVWKLKGGKVLQLWGYLDGKAGTENKHELPPPHDELLLFGDAVVTLAGGVDFTVEAWNIFYEEAFGGFVDLGSSDSEDEEDADADADAEDEDDADEGGDDVDGDAEDDDEEEEAEEEEEEAEEEAEEEEAEEEAEEECFDDGDDGGGGKRRSVRRRTATDSEYRRIDMGLRARVKMTVLQGKRAPKWHTASELEEEAYEA